MFYPCAGGCGAAVKRDECFCKGCEWIITEQYQIHLSATLRNVPESTKQLPKIGFTTDPYFKAGNYAWS